MLGLGVSGLSHGKAVTISKSYQYSNLFQGILRVQLGSSASSTFLSWNLLARSSMKPLS